MNETDVLRHDSIYMSHFTSNQTNIVNVVIIYVLGVTSSVFGLG